MYYGARSLQHLELTALLLVLGGVGFPQKLSPTTRVWSVGPLTKSASVLGITLRPEGLAVTPHADYQTGSTFSATRSVVFAGDRVVLAPMVGLRKVEGAQLPETVYQLFSLDVTTGAVKDVRETSAFGSLRVFATNDAHVIVSGRSLLLLTSDLKDGAGFDYQATGHKFGRVENVSPDGTTLGNATSTGFELIDTRTLKAKALDASPATDTSVSSKGFVTNDVLWVRDYPKDLGFVTYTDADGKHLLYHGKCGGRPEFLTNDLIFEPGCQKPFIIDTHGNIVRTLSTKGASYAGVSQNGKRFALQLARPKHESFAIYTLDTGEPIAEVTPDEPAEQQSWTAFSPDGLMFVVGSPLKLTLYRLP